MVDSGGWKKEADDVASYYSKFDGKLPDTLRKQLLELHQRLGFE
jgi:GTP-dependent phosphoenolpyruvate carboxykinase